MEQKKEAVYLINDERYLHLREKPIVGLAGILIQHLSVETTIIEVICFSLYC